jgi:hypothetical protein
MHLVNTAACVCKAKAKKNVVNNAQQLASDISNEGEGVQFEALYIP